MFVEKNPSGLKHIIQTMHWDIENLLWMIKLILYVLILCWSGLWVIKHTQIFKDSIFIFTFHVWIFYHFAFVFDISELSISLHANLALWESDLQPAQKAKVGQRIFISKWWETRADSDRWFDLSKQNAGGNQK